VTEGLIAQWNFEGTALDETDNNNDGTVYGAIYTAGKVEQGLDFDGVNDYVQVADNSSLDITQSVTMEAWVKLSSYPSQWNVVRYHKQVLWNENTRYWRHSSSVF